MKGGIPSPLHNPPMRVQAWPHGRRVVYRLKPDAKGVWLFNMSQPVSRVLSRTIIYLGLPLPTGSSHLPRAAGPASRSPTVLLRIEFTAPTCLHAAGELLPHLSTFSPEAGVVYFCCTCPRVAPGGCYPLSLPCGARTFLMHGLSPCARDRSADSRAYCNHSAPRSQQDFLASQAPAQYTEQAARRCWRGDM